LLPNYHNLCSKCTQWLRRDTAADSGITNQLVKMRSIHGLDVFELISQLFCCLLFLALNVLYQKIIKSCGNLCRIGNEKVSNLILIITM